MPALVLDCDGVLADTERYGHLPAFNGTFAQHGIPVSWSDEVYARKVLIGGGKERMATLFTPELLEAAGLPADPEAQRALLAAWHTTKTRLYTELVASGAIPARPGIRRIVEQAADAGWTLAVASTSAEASVRAVLEHAVGPELTARFAVFAGDIVDRKKPAPDIYDVAIWNLRLDPARTLVIEDSRNGLLAALAAGLRTLVTTSTYTVAEDFTGAAAVVRSLGDATEPAEVVRSPVHLGAEIQLDDLLRLIEQTPVPPTQERE